MRVPLPDGGQVDFVMSLEDQGSNTLVTQKVTLSGNVSPDMRSKIEQMKSVGVFNRATGGGIPTIG